MSENQVVTRLTLTRFWASAPMADDERGTGAEPAVEDLATTQRRKSLTSLAWHPEADRSGAWAHEGNKKMC